MARGNQPIQMRVDDETRDRWTAAAQDVGLTLTAFIRETVDAAVDVPAPRPKKPAKPTYRFGCPRERHHRPGTYCKACETTPK